MNKFVTDTLDGIEITRAKNVEKHGTHDQKTHGSWAGTNIKDSEGSPTQNSHPEFRKILADYIAEYPQELGHQGINGLLRMGEKNYLAEQMGRGYDTPEYKAEREQNLRGNFSEVVQAALQLDRLISLSPPLAENTTAYRGVGREFANELVQQGVGKTFTDNGFLSTSLEKHIARGFPSSPTGNLLEIKIPKGVKVIEPSKYFRSNIIRDTNLSKEKEIILGRGNTFEITKIEKSEFMEAFTITIRLIQ